MTSNVGARAITEKNNLGFGDNSGKAKNDEDIKADVMAELKRLFRPEFLNRVDDIIVFHKLTQDDIKNISRRMLKTLAKRVKSMEMDIEFDDSAVEEISSEGYDPVYGARPLRRAIQNKIEDPLSEHMLDGKFKAGDNIICKFQDGKFTFEKKASE